MPAKSQTLKNSHGGYAGKTIIARLEIQMDKRRKTFGGMLIEYGKEKCENMPDYWLNKGRYEGLGASVALMRGTAMAEEVSRSDERLGIE